MRTIEEFRLNLGVTELALTTGAKTLSALVRRGVPFVHVSIDRKQTDTKRKFMLFDKNDDLSDLPLSRFVCELDVEGKNYDLFEEFVLSGERQ